MKRIREKYVYTPINPVDSKRIELHGFSTPKKWNFLFPQQSRFCFLKHNWIKKFLYHFHGYHSPCLWFQKTHVLLTLQFLLWPQNHQHNYVTMHHIKPCQTEMNDPNFVYPMEI